MVYKVASQIQETKSNQTVLFTRNELESSGDTRILPIITVIPQKLESRSETAIVCNGGN